MNPEDLWTLTVAASPALGALVAWRLASRARARASQPPGPVVARVVAASGDTPVYVSGRLLAPWEPTREGRVVAVHAETRAGEVRDAAVEGLRLRLDDGVTELPVEGAVRVVVGSREGLPWRELGDVEEGALAWAARIHGCSQERAREEMKLVRALCHGDLVLVRAKIEARPEMRDGAYREAGVRYVLVPCGNAMALYGPGPRPRIPARRITRGAAIGVVAALVFWTVVGMIAGGLSRGGRTRGAFDGDRLVTVFDGNALAARVAMVSPLERRRAHHTLAESLRDQPRPTSADLAAATEHLLAAGDCVGAQRLAMARGDARGARRIDLGERCRRAEPRVWEKAIAAYATGEFAEASDIFDPGVAYASLYASYVDDYSFDLRLHVLAGDARKITGLARRRAEETLRGRATTADQARRATTLECLAAHAGRARLDDARLQTLTERAEGNVAPEACEMLMLDAMELPERRAWIEAHPGAALTRVGALLAWEAGRVPSVESPCGEDWSALLTDPAGAMSRRAPGIEHGLIRAPGYDDGDEVWRAQVDLRCSVAAFEALAGDLDAARAQLLDAEARATEARRRNASAWVTPAMQGVGLLRAAIAMLDGDDDGARRALPVDDEATRIMGATAIAGRTRDGARTVSAFLDARATNLGAAAFRGVELAPDAAMGWDLASARDGTRLADHLFRHAWNGLPPFAVFGDRGVVRGRSGMAQWIDVAAPVPCVRCTVRRRLAELALTRRAARRWGTAGPDELMLASYARALRERRLAVALRVLDDLRENARDLSW